MAIIKVKKKENPYVTVDRAAVSDVRISWGARGLLCYLLSLPSDWEVHVTHLIKQSPSGRDAVYKIISELKKYGYVEHVRCRDSQGRVTEGQYIVYETPQKSLHPENPEEAQFIENSLHPDFPDEALPDEAKPDRANQPIQINTYTKEIKQIKNKTAAKENGKHFNSTMPNQKTSAAAVSLNPSCLKGEDLIIGEKLSECQHKYIALAINSLAASKNVPKEQLKEEINYALISKENFSACGNDFVKKLNTILKLHREDRWTTPIGLAKQKENVIQKAKNEFQVQLSLLESEINQLKEHLDFWKKRADQNQINFYQSELDRVNQALFIHQSKRPSFAQGA